MNSFRTSCSFGTRRRFLILALALLCFGPDTRAAAEDADACMPDPVVEPAAGLAVIAEQLQEVLISNPESIFSSLPEAVTKKISAVTPKRMLATGDSNIPEFPSYSACEKTFFRVATLNKSVDKLVSDKGWLSGWRRRREELKQAGAEDNEAYFDALPPSRPFEDRIIQYVRVKGKPSQFPKHSTVVGVMDNPIRVLSVGYHTGYDAGLRGDHLRMDEIEVGACAKDPRCQSLSAVDTSKVFADRGLKARYSTENEFAIDGEVPPACIVASYRISFQKVDDKCYSDANGNCGFKK